MLQRATPSAAGPFFFTPFGFAGSPFGVIWGLWCLLFDILGAILAFRELGGYFGISEAPWDVILTPRDHPAKPWEEQDGHEVANDRIFVDFDVISGLMYIGFSGPKCLKIFLCLNLFLFHIFSDL